MPIDNAPTPSSIANVIRGLDSIGARPASGPTVASLTQGNQPAGNQAAANPPAAVPLANDRFVSSAPLPSTPVPMVPGGALPGANRPTGNQPMSIQGLAPLANELAPTQAGRPPMMPGAQNDPSMIPADTMEIGGQLFGKGVGYGSIRTLAAGIKPEDAAAITANDGLDKIFFQDDAGKNYVFFVEKGHFEDVRAGYIGRYNGQRIKVLSVDDEANTFQEGVTSVWHWLNDTLSQSVGSEASKSIAGLVATSIGSFIAAAAIKTTAPVAVALPAAKGLMEGFGNAAVSAVTGFINTMASVVMFACAGVGLVSLLQGVRAYYKRGNYRTLDMVTGNY